MGNHARRFLANFSILVAGDVASKFLLLWASVRMAHVVGTSRFGDLAFALAFTAYFSLLVSQGLGNYGVQEVARHPERTGEYVGNILALRFCASLLAAVTLLATVALLGKPAEVKDLILLYGLLFFSSAFSLNWVFQGMEQMKFVATATVISQVLFAALILVFLHQPSQYAWVPVFQFCGEALAALFLLIAYVRRVGPIRLIFDFPSWVRIWKESLPIGLSLGLGMVLYNFDVVLMGFMKASDEVGQYSAAYRIINFFMGLLMLYNVNLYPAISRSRDHPAVLRRIADRSMRYTILFTLPVAVGGMFVARPIMGWIFGQQFLDGAGALRILLWIVPILAGRAVYRATLLSHGLQRDFLWIALWAAAVNTGFNLALIPRYSYLGAAAATLIGELLVFVLVYRRVAQRVVTLEIASHLVRPALACIPMIGYLIWQSGGTLPVLVAGGGAIYLISAWLVGAIRPREILEELRRTGPHVHAEAEKSPDQL